MGEIIFWTIIRIAVVIPVLWILDSYVSQQFWWLISTVTIYAAILHPAVIHYKLFKSENKEKLYWAIYFGKYFNSKVHLYKYPVTDKSLLKKININLNFAIRFLIQNNLNYEIHSPTKTKDFTQDTIQFAQSINADLILIMTTKYITVFDYMFGAKEQKIIANQAKIPVMCVNPKANFATMGQFMFGQ